jgi:hypothetical protein
LKRRVGLTICAAASPRQLALSVTRARFERDSNAGLTPEGVYELTRVDVRGRSAERSGKPQERNGAAEAKVKADVELSDEVTSQSRYRVFVFISSSIRL